MHFTWVLLTVTSAVFALPAVYPVADTIAGAVTMPIVPRHGSCVACPKHCECDASGAVSLQNTVLLI